MKNELFYVIVDKDLKIVTNRSGTPYAALTVLPLIKWYEPQKGERIVSCTLNLPKEIVYED